MRHRLIRPRLPSLYASFPTSTLAFCRRTSLHPHRPCTRRLALGCNSLSIRTPTLLSTSPRGFDAPFPHFLFFAFVFTFTTFAPAPDRSTTNRAAALFGFAHIRTPCFSLFLTPLQIVRRLAAPSSFHIRPFIILSGSRPCFLPIPLR